MSPNPGIDYLAHVRTESDRFAAVLREADATARVPSCPEWTAADLLWHLTEVHWQWAEVVGRRVTDGSELEALEASKPTRPDDPAAAFELYEQTTDALVDALADADDSEAVWTWANDQSVGFVRRFQAHEALLHRVDAELAAGLGPTALPEDLTDDGIDVVLRYAKSWRPAWADWQLSDDVGRVLATDTGREWTVQLGSWSGTSPDSGTTYEPQDAIELLDGGTMTAAFTVNAPSADLDAWFWQRPGFGSVTATGAAAGRFTALVRAGMP